MEASSGKKREKLQKHYRRKLRNLNKAMSGVGIEKRLSIAAYKKAIMVQVGDEVDRGAAVVVNLSGHFVRLQSIHEDHVVVDDPGRPGRANRKVTWTEARAMGYFSRRLVIRNK